MVNCATFQMQFDERDASFSMGHEKIYVGSADWDAIRGKPFETIGKGLAVVDGQLQVTVVEQLVDLASEYNLTQQSALRDSPEMTTFLEEFTVDKYSQEIGSGLAEYEIAHNLNSQHLVLQVWPMYGELPTYEATPLNNNSIRITFSESIGIKQAIILVSSVDYVPGRDMVPWANISNVKYATRTEMLDILDKE